MSPKYENQKFRQGYTYVIGCDEVGRGSLAGPVVAAAVILKPETWNMKRGIRDSKLLLPKKREELSSTIKKHAWWGIGVVDEKIIDGVNIHHATLLAMKRAAENLLASIPSESALEHHQPDESRNLSKTQINRPLHSSDALVGRGGGLFLFIDGKFTIPGVNLAQEAVVGGDNKILSVAAASIVAKVFRDDLMKKYHQQYPIYNFAQHKGYGTLFHRTMIIRHGLSDIHRLTFCSHLI